MSKDNNPNQIDMNFNFDVRVVSSDLENGDQENLSDFEFGLRQLMKQVLDDCSKRDEDPLDRVEVAARMTRKLGRDITKTSIDQWTAMSAVQRRIHIDSLKALCEVVSDYRLMHYFVESCGYKALNPKEAVCAEFGAIMAMRRGHDQRLKNLQPKLDDPALVKYLVNRQLNEDSGK